MQSSVLYIPAQALNYIPEKKKKIYMRQQNQQKMWVPVSLTFMVC